MLNDVLIAPSILSADFAQLGTDVEAIQSADYVHVDVMDGHFVPNLTLGPDIVKAVKAHSQIPLDVHLMISNPDEMACLYAKSGADIVTFHIEATHHAHRLIYALHDVGVKVGVAINPATPVYALEPIIKDIDVALVMSVNPGFGGQSFIANSLCKYKQVRELARERGCNPIIETDGGVSIQNAAEIVAAGANLLVAGSAVYKCSDRAQAIADIKAEARKGLMQNV